MILFLSIFLSLYGGMHWYWYRKAMPVLPVAGAWRVIVLLCLVLLLVAPVMVRFLERGGFDLFARWVAFAGYSWMGFLFLSVSCFLVMDLLRYAGWVLERWGSGSFAALLPGGGTLFFGVTALVSAVFLYSLYEAWAIRTEYVDLYSTKLPKGAGTVTIAQLSDVHLGLMVGEKRFSAMLQAVTAAEPDILVITGDLVDGQMDGSTGLVALLAGVKPRLGKYAVTGNHELYVGSRQALQFFHDAGLRVLQGDAVEIPGLLTLCGVDDPVFGGREKAAAQEREVLARSSDEQYTILLKHRPLVSPESRGKFDLQLSGHVHKGQIFPFELLTRIQFPLPTGLSRIAEGGAIYISRGTGTWGPPLRFLAPPEVTVFRIRHP